MTRRQLIWAGLTASFLALTLVAALEWPAIGRATADRRTDMLRRTEDAARVPEGLALVAGLPKSTFHQGEPIPLSCTFRNGTRSPVTIYRCNFCPNHRVIVTDRDGVELPMTEAGQVCLAIYESGARDQNIKVVVEAGESSAETVDVARLYHYRPGRYRLEVVFDEDFAEPDPLKLVSEAVEFEIE